MQCRLFLDVVVGQGATIFQLLASENETLLVWGNALLVLDFGLDVLNSVRRLHFQSDGFTSQGFDKNLHATTQTQDKMESGFLLDVVIRQGTTILQLFASKDQTLLIWGNALLVLDLGLDIFNGVRRLNFKGNCLAGQSLYKDLHTTSQPQDKMESGFLLDVIVGQGTTILELFASKDQTLLIWGNALFVLNLGFYILNGVRRLNFKSDCFASQSLDKNLHATTETENQMQGGFFLDIVVRESTAIFQLLASKNETLLVWGDTFLVLN